ncbi:regulator of G-protein signaling 21-like [Sinocyclocheilus anshuiensis]|uniref:Regulator of G-protein signaling 21-like n=1 Tax=Sinocyclocheilus anshuiensis TaxID=1608454 RepID=A0A671N5Z4_9TELE|nr:PREDICTED: regulator of G-protein signaling 21-like [Sinocyclocheilus anshuiensis]
MDRLAKMKKSRQNSSKERLIYFRNPDTTTEQNEMKETNWRSRMLFKTFPVTCQSYRPTTEEVTQWAQSLDNLLSSKCGLTALRLFMKSEHSEENIEFWMACEEFKKIRSRSKLKSRAKTIYDKFIRPDSPKEINLDFYTRESLQQSLLIPTQSSFKAAQNRAYFLMEHNSYPRFLDSELYHRLCRFAAGER